MGDLITSRDHPSGKARVPGVTVEVLVSDFAGNFSAIERVLQEKPEIFNHNIETVRSLTPRIRHKATYDRTLSVFALCLKSTIRQGLLNQESWWVLENLKKK